jgi:hypothetical protein
MRVGKEMHVYQGQMQTNLPLHSNVTPNMIDFASPIVSHVAHMDKRTISQMILKNLKSTIFCQSTCTVDIDYMFEKSCRKYLTLRKYDLHFLGIFKEKVCFDFP